MLASVVSVEIVSHIRNVLEPETFVILIGSLTELSNLFYSVSIIVFVLNIAYNLIMRPGLCSF
jgi:hypothetical protein